MSKLIKKPILVPKDVEIDWARQNLISIKGKKGIINCKINTNLVNFNLKDNKFYLLRKKKTKKYVSIIGTIYSLIKNAIFGVSKGYTKKLMLVGIGYKAFIKDNILNLSLGYSHSITFNIPSDIKATCVIPTEILLEGIDKQLLGQTAANIYFFRRPDIYKGKGIRFENQILKFKDTKKN